jgi:hypothetical protein
MAARPRTPGPVSSRTDSRVSLRYDTEVSSRNDTGVSGTCAEPGCHNPLPPQATGRPARFCSTACRVRFHRHRRQADTTPVTVEVDLGSASSRGRPPERAWLVRMRRADRTVIVAIGLRRHAADRLAEQIADLLATPAER